MALSISDIKAWLYITDTSEDATITSILAEAIASVSLDSNTVYGNLSTEYTAIFDSAVRLLVAHRFENREAVVAGITVTKVPLAYDSLIEKLKVQGFSGYANAYK